jgi:cystinosin
MVESSDVVFSLHGSIMSVILVAQIFYFGGFRTTPVSKITKYILSIVFLVCSIYVALIMARTPGFLWIDFLYLLASIKMFLGIGSYMSQVLLNFTRKSTQGFNVWNIILDCTGGLLSLFQLIFDAADMKALRVGIMGNWAKLVVSLISLFFDVS